jgi:hypothetical protein
MGVGSKGVADMDLFGDYKTTNYEPVQSRKGWSSNFNIRNFPYDCKKVRKK